MVLDSYISSSEKFKFTILTYKRTNCTLLISRPLTTASTVKMPAVKNFDERKNADIIDIRGDTGEIDLKNEVVKLLNPESGPRKLPTLLLYDEKGLQLFEDVSKI